MKLVETPIKAVIFDYDGTLVDTETIYNLVHKKLTGRDLDYESKIQLMGRSPLEACQITVKLFNIDMTPEEYLKMREEALDPYWSQIKLLSGAEEIVREMKTKAKISVATGNDEESFRRKEIKKLVEQFDHVICTTPELRGKPAPDLFLASLKMWDNINSSEVIVFEDSPLGILAANVAGMHSVYIPDSHIDPVASLENIGAKATLILKSLLDFDFEQFNWLK